MTARWSSMYIDGGTYIRERHSAAHVRAKTGLYSPFHYGDWTVPYVIQLFRERGGFLKQEMENETLTVYILPDFGSVIDYNLVMAIFPTSLIDHTFRNTHIANLILSNNYLEYGSVQRIDTNWTLGRLIDDDLTGKIIMEYNNKTNSIKTYFEAPMSWPESIFIPYWFDDAGKGYIDPDYLIF